MVITNLQHRILMFLSFCLVSICIIFGHNYYEMKQIERKNSQLKSTNQAISSRLDKTQDSLNIALSRDVLWLTRVTYSETRKPLEMYYISHVVKNRVKTCYNGECSYKDVVLDPYEFSAFNPNRSLRSYYKSVDRYSTADPGGWAAAKQIAFKTYMDNHDPTNGGTHFFARVSMRNHEFPDWAYHGERVKIASNIQENRLRIYRNVR